MDLYRKIPWQHGENHYEIRIYYDDRIINVAAFLNHRPVNGYRHQIQIPKSCDAGKILEKHSVTELVEACKKDIIENRWEAFKKIIAEMKI